MNGDSCDTGFQLGESTARKTMRNKLFAVLALAFFAALNTQLSTTLAQNIAATVAPIRRQFHGLLLRWRGGFHIAHLDGQRG